MLVETGKPPQVFLWTTSTLRCMGIVCGGLYSSFFGQLEEQSDVSGLANEYIILVKAMLFGTAIVGVVCSVRHSS